MSNCIDDNFNAAFLSTDDFATAAKLTLVGGNAKNIKVIFDSEYYQSLMIGDVGIANADPQVLCKSSDITGITQNAALKIGTVTYYVTSVEPDGTGMTRLVLSKKTVS